MKFRSILAGAAALALLAMPAFATDFLGGAVKSTDIGGKMVLTDANGMTLYTYDKDVNPNETTCYDQCAVNWPPLIADAGATAEGEFTLVPRTDGTMMWAYDGKPLYLWIKDTEPGQTTGDGVGEVWHTAVLD